MTGRAKIVAGASAVLVVTLIAGVYAVNRFAYGIPAFLVWRATSGELRGRHRADVNGVSIYYETYGEGRPVLVLHGATAFLETMHNQIRGLVPGHRVIAVDSRAQGRSTDSDAPLTYAQMGDDMIGLLDSMHIQQADVVGWSDGGIIGLDMAMKHPERVRRLVAMGANYDVDGVDFDAVDPDSFADVKLVYDRIAPDPLHFPVMLKKVMTMVHTEPHYTTADLGRIRAPTLIIAGEHDVIRADHTEKLAAAILGSTKVIVAGATHMGPLEKPDIYNAMIVEFLDGPVDATRRTSRAGLLTSPIAYRDVHQPVDTVSNLAPSGSRRGTGTTRGAAAASRICRRSTIAKRWVLRA